jgi:hypothetical protein
MMVPRCTQARKPAAGNVTLLIRKTPQGLQPAASSWAIAVTKGQSGSLIV